MPVVDLSHVARLEEARIAAAFRAFAPDWRPVAGGVMASSAPGSWMNAVVGAGLTGHAGGAEVAEILDYYTSRGMEPRVDLCPFAEPSFIAALATAGFVVRSFDNVLFRPLVRGERIETAHQPPDGLLIQAVNPSDAAEIREYAVVQATGFVPAGESLTDDAVLDTERAARHPHAVPLVARLPSEAGDRVIAACAMEIFGQVATLYGMSVAEPFRGRGIQQAMLAERLRLGAHRGATYATIGSRPGAHTERNARRMGFELAYTKPCLVRPGPGLAPSRD